MDLMNVVKVTLVLSGFGLGYLCNALQDHSLKPGTFRDIGRSIEKSYLSTSWKSLLQIWLRKNFIQPQSGEPYYLKRMTQLMCSKWRHPP